MRVKITQAFSGVCVECALKVLIEGDAALTCSLSGDDDLLIFVVHTLGSFACAIAAGVYCSLKVTEAGPRWDNATLNHRSLCPKLFIYEELTHQRDKCV